MQRTNSVSVFCKKKKPTSPTEELLRRACILDMLVREIKQALDITIENSGGIKGIDYSKTKVDTSTKADLCDTLVATEDQVERLTNKLNQNLAKLNESREAVLTIIDMLEDGAPKAILIARYLNCKTWETIMDETSYSQNSVYRLHRLAIEELIRQGANERSKAILERLEAKW